LVSPHCCLLAEIPRVQHLLDKLLGTNCDSYIGFD